MSLSAKNPVKKLFWTVFYIVTKRKCFYLPVYLLILLLEKDITKIPTVLITRRLLAFNSENIAQNNSKYSCTVRKKWKHENFQYFGDGKWYGWKMFSICFKLKRCQVGTYRYKKNQPGPNLNFFTRTFLSLNIFVRYSDVIGNHAVSFLMNIYYFIYYLLVVGTCTYYFFILVWK